MTKLQIQQIVFFGTLGLNVAFPWIPTFPLWQGRHSQPPLSFLRPSLPHCDGAGYSGPLTCILFFLSQTESFSDYNKRDSVSYQSYILITANIVHLRPCTAKNQYPNLKQIFLEKELRGHSPNFHIHVFVSDLYIPTIDLLILLHEICGPILGIYKSLTDTRIWKLVLRPRNSRKRNT